MSIDIIINQMGILFIMIFAGFLLNKTGLLGADIDSKLTRLVLYFTLPAMILNSVLSQSGERDTSIVLKFFVIAVIMYLALPILSYIVVRILRIPIEKRGIYRFMIIFGNVGFMGFPIISSLFGSDSVLYGGVFNIIFNILAYSYGVILVQKDHALIARQSSSSQTPPEDFHFHAKTLLTPGISISVLAIVIYFLNIKVPDFIVSPISSVGNMTTPLAMLLIGSTLGSMKLKSVFTDVRIYIFTIVKQFLLPLLLFPALKFFIHDEFMLEFTFIMLAMPVANSAVLFAKEYGADEESAARGVFLTTLFSAVAIPVLVGVLF